MKQYLVVNQGQMDCGSFWNNVYLFNHYATAKQKFEQLIKIVKKDFKNTVYNVVINKSDTYFEIYEEEEYAYNNATVEIRITEAID